MKLCHATALALVGWYLMAPPIQHEGSRTFVNVEASLGDWEIIHKYDSADDCQDGKDALPAELLATVPTPEPGRSKVDQAKIYGLIDDRAFGAKCVANDDPHLKGK